MTGDRPQGPLAGMRVLDLSHVMAGPVCGLMLADMGADVIKIERIPIGDDSRQMLTPSIKGESAAFMMMNRNKRGLALDLKKPKGQEVLKRLVKTADALIENYRKGTMEKFGLGYDVAEGRQSRTDLLRDLGLRPHRAVGEPGRLRSRDAGHVGPDVHHRRGPGPAAGQGRRAHHRHHRRPARLPSASTPPTRTSSRPARASASTPRCSRPASSRPTGSRPSPSRPACRPARSARRIP